MNSSTYPTISPLSTFLYPYILVVYLVNNIQQDLLKKIVNLCILLGKFNLFIFIMITDTVGCIYVPYLYFLFTLFIFFFCFC